MKSITILSLTVLAQCSVLGQEAASKPTFEVASVKHLREPPPAVGLAHPTGMAPEITGDPRQINFSAVKLIGVLSRAYGARLNQIVGPDWLNIEWYSIIAKVPDDAPKGQITEMLQNLLADRFQMRVHWETKESQGYALVVGKNGPKLMKSTSPDGDPPPKRSASFSSSGRFMWKATTLDDFAASLAALLGSPVVDMTQIQGVFDIALDAAPDSIPGMHSRQVADSPHPTIFVAIQDLGLRLEARKVPVKQLIVDSAQKVPKEN
jgi:uncharacterized protein (TIGR03435 family)